MILASDGYIEQYERLLGPGRQEGSRWVFTCPFDGCRDARSPHLYVDPETGAWVCFRCCQEVPGRIYRSSGYGGGNWRDFARLVGDDESLWPGGSVAARRNVPVLSVTRRREIWGDLVSLSSLTADHRRHVRERGLDPFELGVVSASFDVWEYLIDIYGEQRCIDAGLAVIQGDDLLPTLCVRERRIIIPYYNDCAVDYFVGYAPGSHVRYAGPKGYPSHLYGVGHPLTRDCRTLIVTEGTFKAAAALQAGFPCVGLQGMGSNHREVVGLCKKRSIPNAIVLFDTQAEGQVTIDRCSERLARRLNENGVRAVVAHLPLDTGDAKCDIDSFLLKYGPESFRALVEEVIQSKSPCG